MVYQQARHPLCEHPKRGELAAAVLTLTHWFKQLVFTCRTLRGASWCPQHRALFTGCRQYHCYVPTTGIPPVLVLCEELHQQRPHSNRHDDCMHCVAEVGHGSSLSPRHGVDGHWDGENQHQAAHCSREPQYY